MCFSADGRHLLTAGEDGTAKSWEVGAAQNVTTLGAEASDFVEADGGRLLTAGKDVTLHSLDPGQGVRHLWTSAVDPKRVRYAEESREVFVRDNLRCIKAFRVDSHDKPVVHEFPVDVKVGQFAVTPDGRRMVAEVRNLADQATSLVLVSPLQQPLVACQSIVHVIGWTPDGQSVFFDQADQIHVVDVNTGLLLRKLTGHRSTIWDACFSQDGKFLATVSKDRTVRIWDWHSGKELWSEVAHPNEATCVGFSPDGETVATTGADRILRLWNWRQETLALEYPLTHWPVQKLSFSKDGRKLFILAEQQLDIYDASPIPVTESDWMK